MSDLVTIRASVDFGDNILHVTRDCEGDMVLTLLTYGVYGTDESFKALADTIYAFIDGPEFPPARVADDRHSAFEG